MIALTPCFTFTAAVVIQICCANIAHEYQIPRNNLAESYEDQLTRHRHKSPVMYHSDKSEYDHMIKIGSDGELKFYWKNPSLDIKNKVLDVQMVYAGRAWLGFGISSNGQTRGFDAIIGKTNYNRVRKYIVDGDEWTDNIDKRAPENQTLQDARCVQDKNSTTLSFKKLLEEDGEISVNPNGENIFLLAVGKENKFATPKETFALKLVLFVASSTPTAFLSAIPSLSVAQSSQPSLTLSFPPTPNKSSIPSLSAVPSSSFSLIPSSVPSSIGTTSPTSITSSSPTSSPSSSFSSVPTKTASPSVSSNPSLSPTITSSPPVSPAPIAGNTNDTSLSGLTIHNKIVLISGVWIGVIILLVLIFCMWRRIKRSAVTQDPAEDEKDDASHQLFLDDGSYEGINDYNDKKKSWTNIK